MIRDENSHINRRFEETVIGGTDRLNLIRQSIAEREFYQEFRDDLRRIQTCILVGLEPNGTASNFFAIGDCCHCGNDVHAFYKVGPGGAYSWTVTECEHCGCSLCFEMETGNNFRLADSSVEVAA